MDNIAGGIPLFFPFESHCTVFVSPLLSAPSPHHTSSSGNVIIKTLAQNRFSASSSSPGYKPHNVKLHGDKCWLSATPGDKKQYLQIDLGERKLIHGLETQGKPSSKR